MRLRVLLVWILDGFLSAFFFCIVLLVTFSPLFLERYLCEMISFLDVQVVAVYKTTSFLWALPLMILLGDTCILIYRWFFPGKGWSGMRHPFERDFYESRTQKYRRRKKTVLLWSAGCIVCILLLVIGSFERTCLTEEGRILRYNVYNQLTEEYSPEDVSKVSLEITHKTVQSHGRYRFHYDVDTYGISFDVDDERFSFSRDDFRASSDAEKIQTMFRLRETFDSDIVSYSGTEHLEKVAGELYFTAEEKHLLLSLFEQS